MYVRGVVWGGRILEAVLHMQRSRVVSIALVWGGPTSGAQSLPD